MRLAADRDMVARQYAEGFHDVLNVVVPWLSHGAGHGDLALAAAIVHVHLEMMSEFPDSLISRPPWFGNSPWCCG